jgi:hypothetical protein
MVITPQDVADRPEWNFAPVAVCGNAERCLINLQQAVRFANHYQKKIIQWRCELVGIATSLPTHAIDFIYESNTTTLTFTCVVGSPCFLTENINVLKGVVNGTPCKVHSVGYADTNEQEEMQDLLSRSWERVEVLPIVPDFLNVELQGFTTWDPNDSLLGAEAYVIPIPIAKKRLIIKVRGQQFQAKVHAVDLGFAITFYKIQGHTLPLLILNPYKGDVLQKLILCPYLLDCPGYASQ